MDAKNNHHKHMTFGKKISLTLLALGFFLLLVALTGVTNKTPLISFILSFGMIIAGSTVYIILQAREVLPGIKNNGTFFNSVSSRGVLNILKTGFGWLIR